MLVTCAGEEPPSADAGLHVDTLDLYQAKARAVFAKCAASELQVEESVIQHDLGRLLLKIEQVIDSAQKRRKFGSGAAPLMTPEDTSRGARVPARS